MKISTFIIIFILLTVFVSLNCKSADNGVSAARKIYQCKDYKLDVPIEAVDVETNGKKNGDTHFHSVSTDSEIFYSYNRFESEEKALGQLNESEKQAGQVLRRTEIKTPDANKIGEKLLISTSKNYVLLWTKGAMLNAVLSESLTALEEIENDCNLN